MIEDYEFLQSAGGTHFLSALQTEMKTTPFDSLRGQAAVIDKADDFSPYRTSYPVLSAAGAAG